MAYNTGNAIGSTDARDLYDNAQNLDKAMNSTDPTWIDRFGVARPTFKGAESELNQKVGDAEAAATQALGYLNTMRATSYGPLAEDPTTDPLGNPCTAGDEYFNTTYNLLKRFDGSIWRVPDINTENLASGAGSSMVGYGEQTVEAALNERLPEIGNYAGLDAYTGDATAVMVYGVQNIFDGGAGVFRRTTDTPSAADGIYRQDALGRWWKRDFSGAYNVLWFGADRSGLTSSQAAFSAAFSAQRRTVYAPQGTYIVQSVDMPSFTRLTGDGYNSVIKSDGSANHVVVLDAAFHCQIDNVRISGNDTKTNLCGIYGNGAVWLVIDNVTVNGNGSHGIHLTDTGTVYSGSYLIQIRNLHSQANNGDGIRHQGISPESQSTTVRIDCSEFQSNGGNGATLWGASVSVSNNTFENNTGYGLCFDNGLSSGTLYSSYCMAAENNYFELNYAGHIHMRVGTYGTINSMRLVGNYFMANSGLLGVGYVPITVDNYSSSMNMVRQLQYESNTFAIVGTDLTTYADFGNALSASCVLRLFSGTHSTTTITTLVAKYTNIGYATVSYIKNLTLNGYWFAKGGSGITWSGQNKSDNVTVSGSATNFPVQIPLGSRINFVSVPVETDCANYTVNMYLKYRAYDTTGSFSNIFASATGSGSQLVKSQAIATIGPDGVDTAHGEWTLQVGVTWTTPGTYFYLGSPSVYYIDP
ncbi:right-handed parallel beta-helix repeat-containing protein [Azonexus caeni]|uniref:right-handed parallel beta-helix repeat-containing protein n=1 Tax=Azonexus caeni TaxID=266126 RepID=UPI003A8C4AE5